MTCVTCGTAGAAGATWCPQCYLPYVRVGGNLPAAAPAMAGPPPAYGPPTYPPPYAEPRFVPPAEPVWPASLGLVVPELAVQTGDLPRICVVSGRPTTSMVAMRWSWAPAWTWLFAVAGVLPVFIIRYLAGTRSAGYLPIHPAVRRTRRWLSGCGVTGVLVGLVLFVAGLANGQAVVAVAGLAMLIAGVAALERHGRILPVRRASPDFLALPKASPEFAAAFRAGRPQDQQPHASEPAKFKTSKVLMVVAGVVVVPLLLLGLVAGVTHGLGCRTSSVHPDVHQLDIAVSQDDAAQSQLAAGANAQGWTPAQGQAVLVADATMTRTLQGLRFSSADRPAVGSFLSTVQAFDSALRTYMSHPSDLEQKAFVAAGDQLQTSIEQLDSTVHSVPQDCTNN